MAWWNDRKETKVSSFLLQPQFVIVPPTNASLPNFSTFQLTIIDYNSEYLSTSLFIPEPLIEGTCEYQPFSIVSLFVTTLIRGFYYFLFEVIPVENSSKKLFLFDQRNSLFDWQVYNPAYNPAYLVTY